MDQDLSIKCVFIGGIYNERDLSTNNVTQIAADTLQKSIITGLNENGINIEIISSPFFMSYPKHKLIIERSEFLFNNNKVFNTSYLNLPLINFISKYYETIDKLKSLSPNIILIYSIHTPFLKAAVDYKKSCNNDIKLILIVPDLPEYMSASNNKLYRVLKKIDNYIQRKLFDYIDAYVLLTEQMKYKLPIREENYIVLEGIYNEIGNTQIQKKCKNLTFLYCGSLSSRYQIIDLLVDFNRLSDKSIRLWLCGNGDSVEAIKDFEKKDSRIKYLGNLTREEALRKQREATILINPRKNDKEYTKYSFPSKTMEYLGSGTACLMYKLSGIPNEYDKYYIQIREEKDGLYKSLKDVISYKKEELTTLGSQARAFILKNKNAKIQSYKIIKLIKEIS